MREYCRNLVLHVFVNHTCLPFYKNCIHTLQILIAALLKPISISFDIIIPDNENKIINKGWKSITPSHIWSSYKMQTF